MKTIVSRLVAVTAFAVLIVTSVPATPASAAGAPWDRYIVVLAPEVSPAAAALEHARVLGVRPTHLYTHALSGYAGAFPPGIAARLEADPRVISIEPDVPVQTTAQSEPTGVTRVGAVANTEIGIDGVDDQRVDVDVAVIDTGIDVDHPDLNVVESTDCRNLRIVFPFNLEYTCEEGGDDDHDHGTHVAGTIGALDNGYGVVGVAPGARLWAVKVLDAGGSGSLSAVIAGIDYVTENAAEIEVANMSLSCECSSPAMDTAITNATDAGVVFAVAAGNSSQDASKESPASHPRVLTASALSDFDGVPGALAEATCRDDQDDTLADFSNHGPLIELTAPGVCILSTVRNGYGLFSGTSMASPHVAGAAALLASGAGKPAGWSEVDAIRSALVGAGQADWTDDSGDGIQEPRLDVGGIDPAMVGEDTGGEPGEPTPPLADMATSCDGLSCSFDGSGSSPSGEIDSYHWTFGDGAESGGVVVQHTYPQAGDYEVTLTVTDQNGGQDVATETVSVSDPQPSTDMFLGELSAWLGGRRNNRLMATVEVVDESSGALSGARVEGYFLVNSERVAATATTDNGGVAVVEGGKIRWFDLVSIFCVESVTHPSHSLATNVPQCVLVQP